MKDIARVTELELKVLQQIWEKNRELAVNEIVEGWPENPPPGYTTILKTLQKMEKKGIVGHIQAGRKYCYFSNVSKENVTQNRLGTIIDRVFSGNSVAFAEYFVKSNEFTYDELTRLKEMILEKEKEAAND